MADCLVLEVCGAVFALGPQPWAKRDVSAKYQAIPRKYTWSGTCQPVKTNHKLAG